jgi:hypothetical protein
MGPRAPEVEPNGPWRYGPGDSIMPSMSDGDLHRIEDDIAEAWIDVWTGGGIVELEEYLAKHAAFQTFLEGREAPAP